MSIAGRHQNRGMNRRSRMGRHPTKGQVRNGAAMWSILNRTRSVNVGEQQWKSIGVYRSNALTNVLNVICVVNPGAMNVTVIISNVRTLDRTPIQMKIEQLVVL